MARKPARGEKPLDWVGSSKEDLLRFPGPAIDDIGTALSVAQFGGKHPAAKFWKGRGPGIVEIVENFDGNAYRAVYTVRFPRLIYVLHVFQKKSPKGIETARSDVELVARRLRAAERDYAARFGTAKE